MFFFGAFSGNLLYLILAISYLAGCSAMVFRGSDHQPKETQSSENVTFNFLKSYQLSDSNHNYQLNKVINHAAENKGIIVKPPLTTFILTLFNPPLLTRESCFSGSALFSRPPPYFLV